ncbi:unnamed protein product [Rotaria magnacalcarata]|uniref:Uncharacterized protein n=1 Tax=Rotaria magnacalcarata TaxID=392030 RepID=A0A817AAH6_9BILA|nr:unnamed protein product [Rotaria magnacalcarata]
MTTNAEYCKNFRQRKYNISNRLQQVQPTPPQDLYLCSDHVDNIDLQEDEVNNYFNQLSTTNDDEYRSHGSSYDDSSIIDSEYETESDSDLDCFTDDDDDGTLLYQDGSISLYQAYKAIKKFIIKCNLSYTNILNLILFILFLLPVGHGLSKFGILRCYKKKEIFFYNTLCINCNHEIQPTDGKCSSTCNFYGKQRTNDSVTELAEANIVDRIKNVVKRNLPLIIEYQQRAHLLLPNDILVTTKRKKFYAITRTILEIPPPHREYTRNKLLFLLYFSENEPTPSILYDNLCQQMRKITNEKFTVISDQKFNLTFQLFKVDLPCRSLSICIKQHNGYYCCSDCLQHGKTVGGTCVYYSLDEKQPTRSRRDYIDAATEAERNQNQISVFGAHGNSPLLSLFFNAQVNCPLDYMHLCCR